MTLVGKYVSTFAQATHALPDGMHMNADYPFMLPKIQSKDASTITIVGRGGQTVTATIRRNRSGEFCEIAQSSTFERMFGRQPTKFRFLPFRDETARG
jgi:hypothetical protein